MNDTMSSESKMKMPRENSISGTRIVDVPNNRILILTLAVTKVGMVTDNTTDRNHMTGIIDDLKGTIGDLIPIKAILTGIIIAEAKGHTREEHLRVTVLELQAAQLSEPHGLLNGIAPVALVSARTKRNRILIRLL